MADVKKMKDIIETLTYNCGDPQCPNKGVGHEVKFTWAELQEACVGLRNQVQFQAQMQERDEDYYKAVVLQALAIIYTAERHLTPEDGESMFGNWPVKEKLDNFNQLWKTLWMLEKEARAKVRVPFTVKGITEVHSSTRPAQLNMKGDMGVALTDAQNKELGNPGEKDMIVQLRTEKHDTHLMVCVTGDFPQGLDLSLFIQENLEELERQISTFKAGKGQFDA